MLRTIDTIQVGDFATFSKTISEVANSETPRASKLFGLYKIALTFGVFLLIQSQKIAKAVNYLS